MSLNSRIINSNSVCVKPYNLIAQVLEYDHFSDLYYVWTETDNGISSGWFKESDLEVIE